MEISDIERGSAADEAFWSLDAPIMRGDLKPGYRLLPEDKLVEQWAVARNTLREAIRKLTGRGSW
jgi:GntR family transcriptional repressor for pyruvate dehydrogenase complex